jgi:dipeptidyl aminopeptidase/acylaminoacyl peptidase
MKRQETFWQAMILFLVFSLTVGIYFVLGWLLHRLREEGQVASSAQLTKADSNVQIVEPLDGAILQRAASVAVQAVVLEPGFVQAELLVDGQRATIQVNPESKGAPWIVQWVWKDAGEGAHTLVVQAQRSNGRVETSPPVTVTVVPRGKLIFASNRDGAYAIYEMETDGSNAVRLTGGPGGARQPTARRDGVLAFVTEAESGRPMIRLVEVDGGEERDLIAGVDPAWAPDGARLAYAAYKDGTSQVFSILASGESPIQATAEEVYAGQPIWSPDGTHLAFVAERDGNWDVWVTAVGGGDARRLTEDPGMDWAPAWSPDGSMVAFVSNRSGSHQIYTMRSDGTEVRLLSDFALGAESPSWSPEGFWLAFVAYTGEGTGINAREIYLMRSDGQNQVRLTQNTFDDTDIEWTWIP